MENTTVVVDYDHLGTTAYTVPQQVGFYVGDSTELTLADAVSQDEFFEWFEGIGAIDMHHQKQGDYVFAIADCTDGKHYVEVGLAADHTWIK